MIINIKHSEVVG